MYRSPFLSLDQLQSERRAGGLQRGQQVSSTFGKTMLDLDGLLREEEARKKKYEQQKFENDISTQRETRADQEAKDRAEYNRSNVEIARRDADRREAEFKDRAERERAEAEAKAAADRLAGARTLLEKHVAAGLQRGMTPEQIAAGARETPGLEEITGDEEVYSEYQRQKQEADQDAANLEIKKTHADAAKTNAARPRVSTPPRPRQVQGLTAPERRDVRNATVTLQVLDEVEQKVRAGQADPGPISNVMSGVRQFLGIRNSGDDALRAQIAGVVNMALNQQFGSAVSAQEMERALMELPTFRDDQEGFLALIANIRAKSARVANATVDIAARNQAAMGADPTGIKQQFPPFDPKTGRPGGTPSAVPPRNEGESRRQYALRLMAAGMSPENAIKEAAK